MAKKRDPRDKVAEKKRPAVNAASISKYTDYDKKEKEKYGVGAKLGAEGSQRRSDQMGVARSKAEDYKSKTGQYPTATTSEMKEAENSSIRNKSYMTIKGKLNK